MITLQRKIDLLKQYLEASESFDSLISRGIVSSQEADKLLFDYVHHKLEAEESQWLLSQLGIPSDEEEETAIGQALSKMVEFLIEMYSIHEDPVIHLKVYPNLTGKVVDEDGESLVCYESFEDCIDKMKSFINNNGWNNLSDEEYAVIAAIRAEPDYQFKQEEKKLANTMVTKRMLEQTGEYTFSVTEYGTNLFKQIL